MAIYSVMANKNQIKAVSENWGLLTFFILVKASAHKYISNGVKYQYNKRHVIFLYLKRFLFI